MANGKPGRPKKEPTESVKVASWLVDKLRELAHVNKRTVRGEIELAVEKHLKGNQP